MLKNTVQATSVILTGQCMLLLHYFLSLPIWPINEGPIQSYIELRPIIKSYFVWKLYIAFVGHSFNIDIVYFQCFFFYYILINDVVLGRMLLLRASNTE